MRPAVHKGVRLHNSLRSDKHGFSMVACFITIRTELHMILEG